MTDKNKEPWVAGVSTLTECNRCKKMVYYKVVPIWKPWYHVICPVCGYTGWIQHEEEVLA